MYVIYPVIHLHPLAPEQARKLILNSPNVIFLLYSSPTTQGLSWFGFANYSECNVWRRDDKTMAVFSYPYPC